MLGVSEAQSKKPKYEQQKKYNERRKEKQGSKLTVVRLSQTTKITMGQPNCAEWLPLRQPKLVPNKDLIELNKYNSLLSLKSKRYLKVSLTLPLEGFSLLFDLHNVTQRKTQRTYLNEPVVL